MTATIEQVINRANEVISENGWCQHKATSPEGGCCLVAAITRSIKDLTGYNDLELFISTTNFLKQKLELEKDTLVLWNDDITRTKEEVLAVLTYD
jgi:hypothetical protein